MSGDKYLIRDQHTIYFITLTVIKWIDIFTRESYREIIVHSLNFCIKTKGLEVFAWVIMSNHVHLLVSCNAPHRMSDFLRDFKKFTSKEIVKVIDSSKESRRHWILKILSEEGNRLRRIKKFKLWKDDNHAIDLFRYHISIKQKMNYIHNNPVAAGIVDNAIDYVYSSCRDYCGRKGLVEVSPRFKVVDI
ncbi:MAG: transposase [Cyclobacteriaceae bacterium]|nr:transposase [Cyclobacteriaceae bacterium]